MFGCIHEFKENLIRQLTDVRVELERNTTDPLICTEGELESELNNVLEHEEIPWFQKSR